MFISYSFSGVGAIDLMGHEADMWLAFACLFGTGVLVSCCEPFADRSIPGNLSGLKGQLAYSA